MVVPTNSNEDDFHQYSISCIATAEDRSAIVLLLNSAAGSANLEVGVRTGFARIPSYT